MPDYSVSGYMILKGYSISKDNTTENLREDNKIMAVVKELIRTEENGSISFGNYELAQKSKVSDFQHQGDVYKVKTFHEITKLERNGMFVYESVPGTAVYNLLQDGSTIELSGRRCRGCTDYRRNGG